MYIIKPQVDARWRVMRYKGGSPPLMISTTLLRHHAHEFSDEHEAKWHRVLRKYGFEK